MLGALRQHERDMPPVQPNGQLSHTYGVEPPEFMPATLPSAGIHRLPHLVPGGQGGVGATRENWACHSTFPGARRLNPASCIQQKLFPRLAYTTSPDKGSDVQNRIGWQVRDLMEAPDGCEPMS